MAHSNEEHCLGSSLEEVTARFCGSLSGLNDHRAAAPIKAHSFDPLRPSQLFMRELHYAVVGWLVSWPLRPVRPQHTKASFKDTEICSWQHDPKEIDIDNKVNDAHSILYLTTVMDVLLLTYLRLQNLYYLK